MFFPDLFLAPTVQASERLNDGGTAIPLLWTNTGEVDSVDGGILAGTEEHSYHTWAMFSSQALTLQLAVLTCHVQTDSLHQSRLIFVPREIWVYSYLDNVMCGRLGRGQLSPWGWLRTATVCISWWRCRPGMLGSFPGFAIDTSLGFLSQSANVLAVLLMGSMAILWCRMMGTELLQWCWLGWKRPPGLGPEPGL